jgi:NDP-sugar pyrophosphorylase family protein
MKDRVTLTLERNLLRQIDTSVDGTTVKNRSHAVELLLYKALDGDMPKHAIVLGGATDEQIKAVLTEFDGETAIGRNVRLLAEAGINNIIVITKELDHVRAAIRHSAPDTHVQYLSESSPLGTAGTLHLASPYVQGPFVLTNGDEVKDVSIREMYRFHREHAGSCTIALTTVPDPSQYGVALLNGNRIIAFVEKPSKENAPSNLISAGLYILEPEVLELIPNGYAKMEYDIFPKLAREDNLYGYHFSGRYSDTEN